MIDQGVKKWGELMCRRSYFLEMGAGVLNNKKKIDLLKDLNQMCSVQRCIAAKNRQISKVIKKPV